METECNNGLDDDCDFLSDCDDTDCAADPACDVPVVVTVDQLVTGGHPDVGSLHRRAEGAGADPRFADSRPIEARPARDSEERIAIWKGRKSAFSAVGRLSPDFIVQDGVVPRTRLPDVLERIAEGGGLSTSSLSESDEARLVTTLLRAAIEALLQASGLDPETSPDLQHTAERVARRFRREFDAAYEEGGICQITTHPHIIGYRSRIWIVPRPSSFVATRPNE